MPKNKNTAHTLAIKICTSGFESVSAASLCLISLATVKNTSSTFMFVLALWWTYHEITEDADQLSKVRN